MRVSYTLVLVVGFLFALSETMVLGPETWAVLIAGSSGWMNYRHQADICHAYQSLIARGVKREQIITFMYDDIAFNHRNPYKGVIINKPDGPNVYEGVKIDYKGKDVTVHNFLNVLLGNESEMKNIGTGRVLKSGLNNSVFINFADHGGSGVLGFPSEYLFGNDLISTIHTMKKENQFGKLVLFIEACESGSLFDNLIEHFDNVFVTTASGTDESSWAWYCNEKKYRTCLGDLFSVSWMERLDKLNESETLFDNYDGVRTRVQTSHVNVYGDYRLGFLEEFASLHQEPIRNIVIYESKSGVDSRDVPLHNVKMEALNTNSSDIIEEQKHLGKMIRAREFADKLITRILEVFTDGNSKLKRDLESLRFPLNLKMFVCYKRIVKSFDDNCFRIYKNTYFLKHLYKLANICIKEMGTEVIIRAIKSVCQGLTKSIHNIDIDIE